jgi:hypothetical protein
VFAERGRAAVPSPVVLKGPVVADLVFVVVVVAFFALCVAYVRLCDRIIGPDAPGRGPAAATPADELEEIGA